MRNGPAVLLALCAVALQGCGWILQSTVTGFDRIETRVDHRKQEVRLAPTPSEASIFRVEGDVDVLIGTGPITETIDYEVHQRYRVNESTLLLFLGGFADALALTAGIVIVANADMDTAPKVLSLTFGSMLGAALAITEWTFAGIWAFEDDELLSSDVRPTKRYYSARHAGHRDLLVQATGPGPARVELKLLPSPTALKTASRSPPQKPRPAPKPAGKVVAVMEVVDVSKDDQARAIDPLLRKNIGDQLRVFVGAGGFRTVDRSSQETMLSDLITEMKSDTYRSCYDEACQIELGKALAAQFILRSQVTRFGEACVLNGELIDLAAEVVVAAGSARGECKPEGFFSMTERLASKIVEKAR